MSHDATNWAIKQRGIKPALKVVLWNLCDRYHPDNGCFPSQDTLADDCEVPRSTLNVYLRELEELGLIAREQRRERSSNRQERTRYRFPFEPDFPKKPAEIPCPETGHGPEEAESRNGQEPSPENGESRVQNLDSNPVREPVKRTGNERGGASASEEDREDDPKRLRERFRALEIGRHGNPWPLLLKTNSDWAFRQFLKLSPEERAQAEELRDAFLAACPKVKSGERKGEPDAPMLGVYLRDKRFQVLGAVAPDAIRRAAGDAAAPSLPCKAFAKGWQGRVYAILLGPERPHPPPRGMLAHLMTQDSAMGERERRAYRQRHSWPEVWAMHEEPRGMLVTAEIVAISEDFRSYHVHSPEVGAWRRLHERMGWSWPDMGDAQWICLPPTDGADDDAVSDALERYRQKLEVRGDEHAA